MGINFNAEFTKLNTNTEGSSAQILDKEECSAYKGSLWTLQEGMTAEKFKAANQHCSEYDTDRDGVVTVAEQKASIASELKNVWTSKIAKFFKDDITYDDSNSSIAANITKQVQARIQNALNYIQYAKDHNKDIFDDNTGTGVDDKDGTVYEYTDCEGKHGKASYAVKKSLKNSDGTITSYYEDGATTTWNSNKLRIKDSGICSDGSTTWNTSYDYYEDGSFIINVAYGDNTKEYQAYDKNDVFIGSYEVTARGNYKASAKEGETLMQTLTRLGITDPADIAAVKKANPKATKKGYFITGTNDVYIPKEVIANMQQNGTFNKDRLMGKNIQMGV